MFISLEQSGVPDHNQKAFSPRHSNIETLMPMMTAIKEAQRLGEIQGPYRGQNYNLFFFALKNVNSANPNGICVDTFLLTETIWFV
mgnify:CR=1 FL=1